MIFVRIPPWASYQQGHPHDLMWPVDALYGAALARGLGYGVRLLDLHVESWEPAALVERLRRARPALLLLDTATPTLELARALAKALRRGLPELPIWAVGQHPSISPEDLLYRGSPFSGVLRGEYEGAITALLEGHPEDAPGAAWFDGELGAVRSVGAPHQVMDLDALPPLDPRGLHLERYRMRSLHVPRFGRRRWGFLHTSRGCPYQCVFCSPTLRQSYGETYRAQSAPRVVDDLARLHRDHGLDAFYLLDDLFSYDRQRVLEICRLLRRRRLGLSWVIQTRLDHLDPEVLAALRWAGCCGVKVGVESGSERVLRRLHKGLTPRQVVRIARQVRRAGLCLTACYMLGNPGETLEEMAQTFRLAREVGADMIQVGFHTPYPGCESYLLHGHEVADPSLLTHYELQSVPLSGVSRERLIQEQRRFYTRYYFSPPVLLNYLRRRAIYRLWDADEWRLALRSLRFWLGRRPGEDGGP